MSKSGETGLGASDNMMIWMFMLTHFPRVARAAKIYEDKRDLYCTSYATFKNLFSQNGRRRPFWMTENDFQSLSSSFQINMQLFFSNFVTKWPSAAILDDRKSLSVAFPAILYQ